MTPPPIPTLDEYFDRWQVLHNAPDVDPRSNLLLRLVLSAFYRLSRPFAKSGVSPNFITFLGLGQAVLALGLSFAFPLGAAVLILVSSLTDGIDGCVAALTNRSSRVGALLDAIADRLSEWCFVGAAVAVGAKPWLGASAAASILLFEYIRARLLAGGLHEVGPVSVGERPTRVIACTIAVGASAFTDTAVAGNVAMAIVIATSCIAIAQLLVWATSRLS